MKNITVNITNEGRAGFLARASVIVPIGYLEEGPPYVSRSIVLSEEASDKSRDAAIDVACIRLRGRCERFLAGLLDNVTSRFASVDLEIKEFLSNDRD